MHQNPKLQGTGTLARTLGDTWELIPYRHEIPADFNGLAIERGRLEREFKERFFWYPRPYLIEGHPDTPKTDNGRFLAYHFQRGAVEALALFDQTTQAALESVRQTGANRVEEARLITLWRCLVMAWACGDALEAVQAGDAESAALASGVAGAIGVRLGLEPLADPLLHWRGTGGRHAAAANRLKSDVAFKRHRAAVLADPPADGKVAWAIADRWHAEEAKRAKESKKPEVRFETIQKRVTRKLAEEAKRAKESKEPEVQFEAIHKRVSRRLSKKSTDTR